jgi:predicted transcriptional regulator
MTPPQATLEDTLCSRVRLRILKVLIEFQTLTPAQIAAEVGDNYVVTRAHLDALEEGDILTHAQFGNRIRYYRFKESAKSIAVRNFIEAWSCPE